MNLIGEFAVKNDVEAHSQTSQKAGNLKEACKFLCSSPGAMTVKEIEKQVVGCFGIRRWMALSERHYLQRSCLE